MVKIGNTSVICGIKCEVTIPKSKPYSSEDEESLKLSSLKKKQKSANKNESDSDSENDDDEMSASLSAKNEGLVQINVELPSICSPHYQHWTDSQQDVSTVQYHIQSLLVDQGVIDRKQLCIVAGEMVWVLYVDIYVLEHDGNLMDACFIAALAALDNLILPSVEMDQGVVKVVPEEPGKKLQLNYYPIPLSFAVLDDFTIIDATSEEESLSKSHFSIIFNEKGKLCSFYKPGGAPLIPGNRLGDFMSFAKQRAISVHRMIKEANNVSSQQ